MYLRSKNIPPQKNNYLFCLLLTGRKEEEEVKQRLDVEGVKKTRSWRTINYYHLLTVSRITL